MDIAVPEKKDVGEKIEVAVSKVSPTVKQDIVSPTEPDKLNSQSENEKPSSSSQEPEKTLHKTDLMDVSIAPEDADRKKLAELITTKRYFLPIHEKRSKPLLTLALLPKKNRKLKKKVTKSLDTSKKSKPKSRQTLLVFVLFIVLVGSVIAIDAGLIDIGVKLPFDLIKNV